MSSMGSVSQWIRELKDGNPDAAQILWERYFHRLVGLARKKMQGRPRVAADEEDVALSAFASFFGRAEKGQFPRLTDRDDLWQLLMVITARKALNQIKHDCRIKRGGGRMAQEAQPAGDASGEANALDQIIGNEPTPDFAAQVQEECGRLLQKLEDDELRAIAVCKMEGHTTDEIAVQLKRAPRTVERKLQLIRSLWEKEVLA